MGQIPRCHPEIAQFLELLHDVRFTDPKGKACRGTAFYPNHREVLGIDPSFPVQEILALRSWRQFKDIAAMFIPDFPSDQSELIILGAQVAVHVVLVAALGLTG